MNIREMQARSMECEDQFNELKAKLDAKVIAFIQDKFKSEMEEAEGLFEENRLKAEEFQKELQPNEDKIMNIKKDIKAAQDSYLEDTPELSAMVLEANEAHKEWRDLIAKITTELELSIGGS